MIPTKLWSRWGAILGVAATVLTIGGALAGATWAVISDRSSVIQRVAIVEQQALQHQKDAGDRHVEMVGRLRLQDDRWAKLEPRLDTMAQDLAVSKAILERMEKRFDAASPAVHSFDGKAQQDQEGRAFPKGQGVGQVDDSAAGRLYPDFDIPSTSLSFLKQ